jgi:hypothetical protein
VPFEIRAQLPAQSTREAPPACAKLAARSTNAAVQRGTIEREMTLGAEDELAGADDELFAWCDETVLVHPLMRRPRRASAAAFVRRARFSSRLMGPPSVDGSGDRVDGADLQEEMVSRGQVQLVVVITDSHRFPPSVVL